MKKIKIFLDKEHGHEALGISEKRTRELGEQLQKLSEQAVEKGIVKITDTPGGFRVEAYGNVLLDIMLNEMAQTEEERLILMVRYLDALQKIHQLHRLLHEQKKSKDSELGNISNF